MTAGGVGRSVDGMSTDADGAQFGPIPPVVGGSVFTVNSSTGIPLFVGTVGETRACAACGHNPACGTASIIGADDVQRWYCHDDEPCSDDPLTCYQMQSAMAMQMAAIAAGDEQDDEPRSVLSRLITESADRQRSMNAGSLAEENRQLRRLVSRATAFVFNDDPTVEHSANRSVNWFTVEHRGGMTADDWDNWAICLRGHSVLTRDGVWDMEPIPSERSDDWRATCRFPFVQAIAIAEAIETALGVGRRLVNLQRDDALVVDEIVKTVTLETLAGYAVQETTPPNPETSDLLDVWQFNRDLVTGRPYPPYTQDDWDDLTGDQRSQLNAAYNLLLTDWRVGTIGYRRIAAYEEGALRFCGECLAGGSALGEPVRGLDSYGDCAEDGETVYWIDAL